MPPYSYYGALGSHSGCLSEAVTCSDFRVEETQQSNTGWQGGSPKSGDYSGLGDFGCLLY
jgi:hypothetical protein